MVCEWFIECYYTDKDSDGKKSMPCAFVCTVLIALLFFGCIGFGIYYYHQSKTFYDGDVIEDYCTYYGQSDIMECTYTAKGIEFDGETIEYYYDTKYCGNGDGIVTVQTICDMNVPSKQKDGTCYIYYCGAGNGFDNVTWISNEDRLMISIWFFVGGGIAFICIIVNVYGCVKYKQRMNDPDYQIGKSTHSNVNMTSPSDYT